MNRLGDLLAAALVISIAVGGAVGLWILAPAWAALLFTLFALAFVTMVISDVHHDSRRRP